MNIGTNNFCWSVFTQKDFYNQYLRSVIPFADILHYCYCMDKVLLCHSLALGNEVYYHTSEVMNSVCKS
jgi:hypothetical protein